MAGSATPIGNLFVDLGLNSASFISNMQKAAQTTALAATEMQASLSGIDAKVSQVTSGLNNLLGALAVEKLLSWTQQAISSAAEIGHLSDAVGLTTEQFQKYQIAAEQVGIEQDRFNTAITRFATNLGGAKEGTGALVSALQTMNPQLLAQLQASRSMDDALQLLFKSLSNTTDASERSRLAVAAFGRGMQQASLISEKLASDLNEKLAIPHGVIEGAKELNDQLDLAKTAIANGFTTGVVAAFAGDLKTSDDTLVQLQHEAAQFGFMFGGALEVAVAGVKYLIANLDLIPGKLNDASKGGAGGISGVSGIVDDFDKLDKALSAGAQEVHAFLREFGIGWEYPKQEIGQTTEKLNAADKAAKDFADALAKLEAIAKGEVAPALDDTNAKLEKETKDLDTTNASLTKLIGAVGSGPVAFEKLKASLDALDAAQKANINTTTAEGQAWLAATAKNKELSFALSVSQSLYAQTEGPLQKYQDELQKIALAEQQGGKVAQATGQMHVEAAAAMAAAYLEPIAAIAGSFEQLFAKNKAFALASAAVSAALGIAKAFELPFPLNWEQAAAVAAATAVQVQKIESTTIGSGSSASSSVSSSSGKTAQGSGVQAVNQQAISIVLQGDQFGRQQLENLVGQLKQYQVNGGSILLQ